MKPGLLAALLASMSVSSIEHIDLSKIKADEIRLLQEYVTPEIRDFIGDALLDAAEKGTSVIELQPPYHLDVQAEDLQALSLIYSGYTGNIVEITTTKISVVAKKKNKATA